MRRSGAEELSALDDVSGAVNFATGKATVTAPALVPAARLIEAVEQAGYGADLVAPGGRGTRQRCGRGGA